MRLISAFTKTFELLAKICQSGSFEIYVADTRKGQGCRRMLSYKHQKPEAFCLCRGRKLVRTVTSGGSFGAAWPPKRPVFRGMPLKLSCAGDSPV